MTTQNITIKNDANRLKKEDIERLEKEAEEFKDDDEKVKQKLESINSFESLLYQTKSSLDNKEFSEKLSEEDRETITEVVTDNETWFNENRDSCTKEEIDTKATDMQTKLTPIMTKLMPQGEGGMPSGMPGGMPSGMPGGMPDMSGMPDFNTSTIDEVD